MTRNYQAAATTLRAAIEAAGATVISTTFTSSLYLTAESADGERAIKIRYSDHAQPFGRGGWRRDGEGANEQADLSFEPGGLSLVNARRLIAEALSPAGYAAIQARLEAEAAELAAIERAETAAAIAAERERQAQIANARANGRNLRASLTAEQVARFEAVGHPRRAAETLAPEFGVRTGQLYLAMTGRPYRGR